MDPETEFQIEEQQDMAEFEEFKDSMKHFKVLQKEVFCSPYLKFLQENNDYIEDIIREMDDEMLDEFRQYCKKLQLCCTAMKRVVDFVKDQGKFYRGSMRQWLKMIRRHRSNVTATASAAYFSLISVAAPNFLCDVQVLAAQHRSEIDVADKFQALTMHETNLDILKGELSPNVNNLSAIMTRRKVLKLVRDCYRMDEQLVKYLGYDLTTISYTNLITLMKEVRKLEKNLKKLHKIAQIYAERFSYRLRKLQKVLNDWSGIIDGYNSLIKSLVF